MPDDIILLDRRADGVAVVTLNSPKVNALSTALLARLGQVADELTSLPPGAVVVTGGERIFAAGADISEFGGPDEARVIGAAFHTTLDKVAARCHSADEDAVIGGVVLHARPVAEGRTPGEG